MPTEPVIEVSNLVRRFGDRAVINDISLTIHRGETLVIMDLKKVGAGGKGRWLVDYCEVHAGIPVQRPN